MAAPTSVAAATSGMEQAVAGLSLKEKEKEAVESKESKRQEKEKEKEAEDADDSSEGEDEECKDGAGGGGGGESAAAKKKKKKKKKKKTTPALPVNACGVHLFCQGGRNPAAPGSTPSKFNVNKAAVQHRIQTSPVSIPIADCFKNHVYPEGELLSYPQEFNTFRVGSEEKRASERQYTEMLNEIREAAEVHRQVRADFMRWVKPGLSMLEVAHYIEAGTSAGLKAPQPRPEGERFKRGFGFPTGCSLNHVAAHYTPNYKDTQVLREGDVMKIDIGTQVNGHIVDSAFTVAFDAKFDPLLNAVKEATETGLREAGIDVRLCDIGGAIQEVMESFEIELNGVTYPIKPIRNLNGHNIGPYRIHYGKSVPIVRNQDQTKMEEGEFYAIETFGSTGRGFVVEDGECSHYMKNYEVHDNGNHGSKPLRTKAAKDLLRHIDGYHGTLAFCRRWLEDEGCKGYLMGLKELMDADIVHPCPPLCDIKGSYTAQFEHTFFLRPTCKEILSRGDDY